MYKLIDMLQ